MTDKNSREIRRRYIDTELMVFVQHCIRLGSELAQKRPRSYRERNELAEDAVDALLEVGRRFHGGPTVPGSPEMPASCGTKAIG